MDLPAEVVDDLKALGWRGPLDEVLRYWREDPNRVENLLWYAQRKGWGGGLFRNALRSGEWPPELKPDSAADLDRWRKEAERLAAWSQPDAEADTPLEASEPPSATPDLPPEVRRWWTFVREQLAREMPKSAFDAYVRPARLWAFEDSSPDARVTILASTPFARDWLANRMTKILERKLTGVAARPVTVQFITLEDTDG